MGRIDVAFKALAERRPRVAVREFGHAGDDPPDSVEPIERELALPPKAMDYAYLVTRRGESWVEHLEAETSLSQLDMRAILKRAALLRLKTDLQVRSTIVLLSKNHPAAGAPPSLDDDGGSIYMSFSPRYDRLWKKKARTILDDNDVDVLPIVGGMDATPQEIDETIRRLLAVGDRNKLADLRAEFITWASLKYNEDEIAGFKERLGTMVTFRSLLEASPQGEEVLRSKWQEGVEKGREEGREKGREEGRERGIEEGIEKGAILSARESLAILAESRFPGLLDPALTAGLSDLPAVRELFRALATARDRQQAQSAIARALNPNTN